VSVPSRLANGEQNLVKTQGPNLLPQGLLRSLRLLANCM